MILNLTAEIMVNPGKIGGGDHPMFVSGHDAGAKATVGEFLKTRFGWKNLVDLGDITTARDTESFLPLWIRLWGALKPPELNIKIVR